MFDLMLHVLSQFIYRLVVPVDDAIDVKVFSAFGVSKTTVTTRS